MAVIEFFTIFSRITICRGVRFSFVISCLLSFKRTPIFKLNLLACLVPGLGLEPKYTVPKTVVLPLDDPGITIDYIY